jgi:adenine deaminase
MGTTNSVAEFVRVVTKILQDLIPHRCMLYMDDIAVKGLKDAYYRALIEQGVQQFIREYIININKVLRNLELAGATALGFKSDWCYNSLGIVSYIVNKEG